MKMLTFFFFSFNLTFYKSNVTEHPWLQNVKKAPNVPLGETVKARLKQFSVMNKLKKRALMVILSCCSIWKLSIDYYKF